ncbi:hypothetical protein JQM83_13455 [Parabacteroides distasonis]|nr:hypothetical protein [Parabacteroides distasonis]
MSNSVRVLKNTIVLYTKVISSTLIWLYLIRVVLDVLGVEDYGIYTLIAGVIAVMSFVNTALMSSTQRFLSIALGEGDENKVKEYFSASMIIHITIALIIIITLESIAPFLFDGFLNIPESRLSVSMQMYQLMVASTFVTIIGVPYSATINAYEDMWFTGIVHIVGTFLKLGVIILFDILLSDKLLVYTGWITFIIITEVLVQYVWCKIHYFPCRKNNYSFSKSKKLIREMIGFTGWNTLGAFAVVGRNQGVTTVLNVFFGPKINGIFGIANQVDGQLISFANTLTAAITPQIIKSEGQGDRKRLLFLSVFSSKLTFFLSAIFAVPLLLELPLVLGFWLKEVPDYTDLYCRIILYMFLICELYPGLTRGIQAVGQIKWQQILTSGVVLIPIPIGITLYKLGFPHYTIIYLMLVAQTVSAGITIYYSRKYYNLSVCKFLRYTVRAVLVFMGAYLVGYFIDHMMIHTTHSLIRFFVVSATSDILFVSVYYLFCFTREEKNMIASLTNNILKKIH